MDDDSKTAGGYQDWMPSAAGDNNATATYYYTDENGVILFGVCRNASKEFRQWRPDRSRGSGRKWSLKDDSGKMVRLVLYNLRAVLNATAAGETVYVCEGEKDADRLQSALAVNPDTGWAGAATTSPMGAGKWHKRYAETLRGADVVIVADKDGPGWSHARTVAASLDGVAASARVVCAREGKDASDHLDAGHAAGDFEPVDLAAPQPDWARGEYAKVAAGSGTAKTAATSLTSPVAAVAAVAGTPGTVAQDGAGLLDKTCLAVTSYVVFASEHHARAAVLFAAATHAAHRLQVAPRLRVKSPVMRCGKTRLLQVLTPLVARPLPASNASVAALVRSMEDVPTLVLDEMDAVFGKRASGDEKAEALRGILNAGFDRGAPYLRYNMESGTVEAFPTFAMAILAGIGDLPGTIEDRAVILPMARKTAGAAVARFRIRRAVPALEGLGARLAAWIGPLAEEIGAAEPAMPDGLSDRAEDVWEPLLAVADAAGGDWPVLARLAAVAMAGEAAEADASVSVRLLADLQAVFGAEPALWTSGVLARLAALEESPWGTWHRGLQMTASDLGTLLRPFGIRSHQVKDGGQNRHGYYAADFRLAWDSYLPGSDLPGNGQEPPGARGSNTGSNPSPDAPPDRPASDTPAPGVPATAATAATAQVSPVAAQNGVPLPAATFSPCIAPPPPNLPALNGARPPVEAPLVLSTEMQARIDRLLGT